MNRWAIKPRGRYPIDWDEMADAIKKKHNYICERCDNKHDPSSGYCMTVHHLDGNKANCAGWNLAVLCQRCHLKIQQRVNFENLLCQESFDFYELPEWLQPHFEGYLRSVGKTITT